MANPFQVDVVNPLQALLLGQQSYAAGIESNKKRAQEAARTEAGQLYAAGDTKGALARLLAGGDLQGANTYSGLDQQAYSRTRDVKNDERQAARDRIADQHWAASHGLAVRAANRADQDKFGIKEVTDPVTGATSFVKYNTTTGEVSPTGGAPIGPSAPMNPFSDGGKFNEGEGKAAGFTDRMLQSEGILRGTPKQPGIEAQGANLTQTGLSKIPLAGNYLVSQERQKFEQAKRDFINAQLRRESGAAISSSEFDSANKQYFPVPGDSEETINQKAQNRRAAVEAMGREGGKSYRPKAIYTADGRVVPLPKVGELKDGYRFKGGDPANPNSWAKAQ